VPPRRGGDANNASAGHEKKEFIKKKKRAHLSALAEGLSVGLGGRLIEIVVPISKAAGL